MLGLASCQWTSLRCSKFVRSGSLCSTPSLPTGWRGLFTDLAPELHLMWRSLPTHPSRVVAGLGRPDLASGQHRSGQRSTGRGLTEASKIHPLTHCMAMGEPPPPLCASYESTTCGSAFRLLLSLHSSKLTTSSACRRATPLDCAVWPRELSSRTRTRPFSHSRRLSTCTERHGVA